MSEWSHDDHSRGIINCRGGGATATGNKIIISPTINIQINMTGADQKPNGFLNRLTGFFRRGSNVQIDNQEVLKLIDLAIQEAYHAETTDVPALPTDD